MLSCIEDYISAENRLEGLGFKNNFSIAFKGYLLIAGLLVICIFIEGWV